MKLIPFSTGSLKLKPTFFEGSPAHGGALGLIWALSRDPGFSPPLPMWSWIIETGTERILVDAGGNSRSGGGLTRTAFSISRDQEIIPELAHLGLKPQDFDRVLLTHLHGDHVGGLGAFDPEQTWVARDEWAPVSRLPGSLLRPMTAPVPKGFTPRLFDFDGPPAHGFPRSHKVTPDGSILALPTPGHSPGHTSFLVRRPEGDALIAGDVTYELAALEAQQMQGFIADVRKHRETLPRVRDLVRSGVRYLPSHDPMSPSRL